MSEPPAPITPRWLDRGFRWRGEHDVSRLESLSDGVFALVLALLFLGSVPPESFTELKAVLKAMVPAGLAFAIIAYLWVEHWIFSRRFNLRDPWTAFLNLVLLFLLLVYAYPLKYLFTLICVEFFGAIGDLTSGRLQAGLDEWGDGTMLFSFYSGGYLLIFVIFVLMYRRALKNREMLQLNEFELYETHASMMRFYFQIGVAVISIGLAFIPAAISIGAPGWIYCLLGPGMGILGYVQGVRGEQLRQQVYGTDK